MLFSNVVLIASQNYKILTVRNLLVGLSQNDCYFDKPRTGKTPNLEHAFGFGHVFPFVELCLLLYRQLIMSL